MEKSKTIYVLAKIAFIASIGILVWYISTVDFKNMQDFQYAGLIGNILNVVAMTIVNVDIIRRRKK